MVEHNTTKKYMKLTITPNEVLILLNDKYNLNLTIDDLIISTCSIQPTPTLSAAGFENIVNKVLTECPINPYSRITAKITAIKRLRELLVDKCVIDKDGNEQVGLGLAQAKIIVENKQSSIDTYRITGRLP